MITRVDFEKLIPAEQMVGDDAEDTALLKKMLGNATDYLQGFQWCPPIDRIYFGCGVGGIVAVFLFHFQKPVHGKDEWLWVIDGDLPSAYLVINNAGDPVSALEGYCQLMQDWAHAVSEGKPLNNIFPVKAEASCDNAKNLMNRLTFIRTRIIPEWRNIWSVR